MTSCVGNNEFAPGGDNVPRPVSSDAWASIYDRVRAICHRLLRYDSLRHREQATEIANDTFIKVRTGPEFNWTSEAHLVRIIARAVRQVMVQKARWYGREKRSGNLVPLTIDIEGPRRRHRLEILALDEALQSLADRFPELASIVEARVFADIECCQIAAERGKSTEWIRQQYHMGLARMLDSLRDPRCGTAA